MLMSYGFVPERFPKVKCAWVGMMIENVLDRKITIVKAATNLLLNYQCPGIWKQNPRQLLASADHV